MPFYIARCQWRHDGAYTQPDDLPDAWSLLDEEFYSPEEAREAAEEDRLQQMQQRGSWMGVHRIGLQRLSYRFFEAPDFDQALARAKQTLRPAQPAGAVLAEGDEGEAGTDRARPGSQSEARASVLNRR